MNISFELTIEDWMAFQKHYLSTSKQYKRTKLFVTSIVPVVFSIFFVYEIIFGNGKYATAGLLLIFAILWVILYPRRYDNNTLKNIRKMINEGDNSSLIGMHSIEFNDDNFIVNEPGSEQTIKWSAISKVEETQEYIFIYVTAISACIIPKFKVEQNGDKVIDFINHKIT